ncbi:hypothetical protein P4H32_30385 [Bacillus cereus]|nr:hypothetical protein [Bacillus cereus]
MKIAYADPPYIGCAHLYPEKTEVDHVDLITKLVDEYPDGWALSLHTPSLQYILSLCPSDVRVMAWVKPFAVFKPNVGLAYAWEPVIIRGGRKRTREQPTVRDWFSHNITMKKGLVGAKPELFAYWIFDALNLQKGDEFHDIFPGTGVMMRCWEEYVSREEPLQMEFIDL